MALSLLLYSLWHPTSTHAGHYCLRRSLIVSFGFVIVPVIVSPLLLFRLLYLAGHRGS